MKNRNRVIAAFTLVCGGIACQLSAGESQLPNLSPRPGEGWTREEARTEPRTPTLDVIPATVVKLSIVKKTGRFIVTLDNGTQWSQTENKPDVRVDIGDDIKLKKATIGSYLLVTKDGVSTRVKRDR